MKYLNGVIIDLDSECFMVRVFSDGASLVFEREEYSELIVEDDLHPGVVFFKDYPGEPIPDGISELEELTTGNSHEQF